VLRKVLMAQGFIAAGLFLVISTAAMKIDANRFSMHTYRNRLVRAFLGGARAERKGEDRFTGFDPKDNRRASELKAQKPPRPLSGHQRDAQSGGRRKPRMAGAEGEFVHPPWVAGSVPSSGCSRRWEGLEIVISVRIAVLGDVGHERHQAERCRNHRAYFANHTWARRL
jgi:hypothetical protein